MQHAAADKSRIAANPYAAANPRSAANPCSAANPHVVGKSHIVANRLPPPTRMSLANRVLLLGACYCRTHIAGKSSIAASTPLHLTQNVAHTREFAVFKSVGMDSPPAPPVQNATNSIVLPLRRYKWQE